MTNRRFFAMVWRVNAVAILLTTILACGVLLFVSWQIYKDATRTRQVSNVVNVADAQLDRSKAQLDTFEKVAGSVVLRAPLRLEQEYGSSSGSKGTSSVQNYLFYDPSSAIAYWLVPGYKGLFLSTHELPEQEYVKPEKPVVAVVYELVDSDSTGDKRLTAKAGWLVRGPCQSQSSSGLTVSGRGLVPTSRSRSGSHALETLLTSEPSESLGSRTRPESICSE